jgi:SNF2 family DNA or RNA helicase
VIYPGTNSNHLFAEIPLGSKWIMDSIPGRRWDKSRSMWVIPITRVSVKVMRKHFRKNDFTPDAISSVKAFLSEIEDKLKSSPFPGKVLGVTMAHQRRALDDAHLKDVFFFNHAMGTGKSLTLLTLSNYFHEKKGLGGLVVVCPSSIKFDTWESEIDKWMPQFSTEYSTHVLVAGKPKAFEKWLKHLKSELAILVVGVEALSIETQSAYKCVDMFLGSRKCGIVVDESSEIKSGGKGGQSKRSKNIEKLGEKSFWRWCATGTPVTQGIHDLYAQFSFLDKKIIGQQSYFSFRGRYCIMGGFENRKIVSYNNVDELMWLIGPYTSTVRKEDANDLPPKIYQVRTVSLSAEQKKIYSELKHHMETQLGNDRLEVVYVIHQMMRLQQVVGGHFPYYDEAKEKWMTKPLSSNPKLDELFRILDETDEKVIVWSRFVSELEQLHKAICGRYGEGYAVLYYGGNTKEKNTDSLRSFKTDQSCKVFVASSKSGGMGLTITVSTMSVYYSNDFSLKLRLQSEDRNHRTSQTKPVTYIDLMSDCPVDKNIMKAIKTKKSMADFVTESLKTGFCNFV